MHSVSLETSSVLRGRSEARFCELQEISPVGATLRIAGSPPASPVLLSVEIGGEHVVLPVVEAHGRPDGRIVVSFACTCEHRLERLLAAA